MTAAGVLSHSSAKNTSSSSSPPQNETVFLPRLLQDEPQSLPPDGDVRPDVHGLGAALSSGVIGGVSLRQLLSVGRVSVLDGSSDMAWRDSGSKSESGRMADLGSQDRRW